MMTCCNCCWRVILALCFCLVFSSVRATDLGRDGVDILVTTEPDRVDVARDFFVTFTITAPQGLTPVLPDLRDRFTGFRVAEDFAEDPLPGADGRIRLVSRWRLVPEPVAAKYRLAPFVMTCLNAAREATICFCTAPVYFRAPEPREPVTGTMEIDPKKDLPPLSWKLVGYCALALAVLILIVFAIWWIVRKIRTLVRVHRMSPIERAYYELDRLLNKGLPGRGLYKDFYVELTMVVRRYVARRYGIKAPNMTTQEFFDELMRSNAQSSEQTANLRTFLESADLVKFAGVEATPVMADAATDKARDYLTADAARVVPPSTPSSTAKV